MIIIFPIILYFCAVVAKRKNTARIKAFPERYKKFITLNKKNDINKIKVGAGYEEVN